MSIEIEKAAIFSKLGDTISICRHGGEIIAFINGTPMPYRFFYPLFLSRLFGNATLSHNRMQKVGCATTELWACLPSLKLNADGYADAALAYAMRTGIDHVLTRAAETAETPADGLQYLINQIEEQHAAAINQQDK